ncbi:ABC-type Fe3+-siderophore transport system, permease component [Archaeoglobus sulfaticallidus PM70-1]|uniref:ABC-type Fe3+-siderophore transport system, permease component n=1 Tax=Archaeoglobus sulfaticallidus PM70-1 TaxID=387631 RepID=N0BFA2_9EURY|nr:iron ABC transporter permease [Archaeoglobus sulfaticallidus]AGK60942.1 ABC-type Fe3+-siderophore transport system, permease component [Archaeoglobus sulfaticallidus PM70-1]
MVIALLMLNAVVFVSYLSLGYQNDLLLKVLTGNADKIERSIVIDTRLPRFLTAVLVGASLSASGCAMQALFRNPLAEPYILGVASGASVGAAIATVLGFGTIQNKLILAFVSALLTSYLVYEIGTTSRFRDQTYAILLAGIAIASFFSGLTSLIIYFFAQSMHKVVFWIMGSFSNPQWSEVYFALPITIAGIAYLLINSWNLNALLLGDEHAMAVGVDVNRFRKYLIAVIAVLTSSAVAVSGVIGFVGIIIPHTMRMLVGEEHQKLLPLTILFAMLFMPLIDLVAKTATTGELPVGAITAMLGGPFFVYILWRKV